MSTLPFSVEGSTRSAPSRMEQASRTRRICFMVLRLFWRKRRPSAERPRDLLVYGAERQSRHLARPVAKYFAGSEIFCWFRNILLSSSIHDQSCRKTAVTYDHPSWPVPCRVCKD